MKKFIISILLFIPLLITSQNLVVNPSFEDTCRYPFWPGNWLFAEHWYSPTIGTPDYFSIFNIVELNVPDNTIGSQYANNGNAYCGFYAFDKPNYNAREYLQSTLIDSLKNNKRYIVSFYVNLADNALYATSRIGAYFSVDSITCAGICVLYYQPQISNDTLVPLTDKVNWYKISGSFIANGREKYITIGNFRDDAHTDTMYVGGTSGWQASYYYIDDVSVELDTTQGVGDVAVNKPEIIIYPQPAWDKIQVRSEKYEVKSLEIYNLQGLLIKSFSVNDKAATIDVSSLPSGMYFVKAKMENGVVVKKFVKE